MIDHTVITTVADHTDTPLICHTITTEVDHTDTSLIDHTVTTIVDHTVTTKVHYKQCNAYLADKDYCKDE